MGKVKKIKTQILNLNLINKTGLKIKSGDEKTINNEYRKNFYYGKTRRILKRTSSGDIQEIYAKRIQISRIKDDETFKISYLRTLQNSCKNAILPKIS